MQTLLIRDGVRGGAYEADGDRNGDVGAVHRSGGAVEDLRVQGADGGVAVAAVFVLDDPAPAKGARGGDDGAEVRRCVTKDPRSLVCPV
jgi:hypothetical protein